MLLGAFFFYHIGQAMFTAKSQHNLNTIVFQTISNSLGNIIKKDGQGRGGRRRRDVTGEMGTENRRARPIIL